MRAQYDDPAALVRAVNAEVYAQRFAACRDLFSGDELPAWQQRQELERRETAERCKVKGDKS